MLADDEMWLREMHRLYTAARPGARFVLRKLDVNNGARISQLSEEVRYPDKRSLGMRGQT